MVNINNNVNNRRRAGNLTGRPTLIYGFSVIEIARGVNVHPSTISRIFSGSRRVSLNLAWRIAHYCSVPLERIAKDLYGEGRRAKIARSSGVPIEYLR